MKGSPGMASIKDALWDALIPSRCCHCEEPAEIDGNVLLCDKCREKFMEDSVQRCPRCGLAGKSPGHCVACRTRDYCFRAVVVLGSYEDDLRQAAIRCKRFSAHPLCFALGKLLAERVATQLRVAPNTDVVPIPKYWLKRWLRGYNAAEVLAEAMAERLNARVRDLLWCGKNTRKQSLLSRTGRQQNLRGAFRLRRKSGNLAERSLIVVDDIMTTGATASEAARVLRSAGARCVSVAVVARAEPADAQSTISRRGINAGMDK